MDRRVSEILSEISQHLKTCNHQKTLTFIPTDIKYYKPLCRYTLLNPIDMPIILFLYVQTNSPFSANKLLSKDQIKNLLLKLYQTRNTVRSKYVVKIAANLLREEFEKINNIVEFKKCLNNTLNDKNSELENKPGAVCQNTEKIVDDEFFYGILLNLSIASKSTVLSSIRLEKDDPVFILRFKAKILSNFVHTDIINNLVSYMNVNNTLLGVAISKAIYKIILKSTNPYSIIHQLQKLADSIFAKEFLFINLAQVFAYLILRGMMINVEDLIIKMINYDNKVVYNNEQVRETGLLLLWSCIRSEVRMLYFDVLCELILVAMFDCSLNCRRAATSVMIEFFGRNRTKNSDIVMQLINFESIKRLERSCDNFKQIVSILPEIEEKIYKLCKRNLFGFKNLEDRKIFAQILLNNEKCFCSSTYEIRDSFNYKYGVCVYFNVCDFCNRCHIDKRVEMLANIDLKGLQNHKHFDKFVKVYANTMSVLWTRFGVFSDKNIIFYFDKNFLPQEMSILVAKIDNKRMNETIHKNLVRKQNSAYILANANNQYFHDSVSKIYLKILQGADSIIKATVIKALHSFINSKQFKIHLLEEIIYSIKQHAKLNIEYMSMLNNLPVDSKLLFYILLGLEDYSVYIKGDAGYFVRRNAIEILSKEFPEVAYKYQIRYFVDKSPKLRNVVKKLFDSNIPTCPFFTSYSLHHDTLIIENDLSDEHIHFNSAFIAYNTLTEELKEEFIIGILATFKNSCAYTKNYLKSFLYTDFGKYKEIIYKFLNLKKRYFFLASYFICNLVEERPEYAFEINVILNQISLDDKGEKLCKMIANLKTNFQGLI